MRKRRVACVVKRGAVQPCAVLEKRKKARAQAGLVRSETKLSCALPAAQEEQAEACAQQR